MLGPGRPNAPIHEWKEGAEHEQSFGKSEQEKGIKSSMKQLPLGKVWKVEKCRKAENWVGKKARWPTPTSPRTASAGEGKEEREPSCAAGGKVNCAATVEDNMEVP